VHPRQYPGYAFEGRRTTFSQSDTKAVSCDADDRQYTSHRWPRWLCTSTVLN